MDFCDLRRAESLPEFSDSDKKQLLAIARRAIARHLNVPFTNEFQPLTPESPLQHEIGAFVTLTIDGELQGCIGHIIPRKPLVEEIAEIAVQSAADDPRFMALQPEEFAQVELEITLLGPFTTVKGPEDILVGRDGLLVQRRFNRGLLLPQVASERHWDSIQFLNATCQKAGLPKDQWRKGDVEIMTFTAIYFKEGD
jgi:AmmeMemoRadiSam system protein A